MNIRRSAKLAKNTLIRKRRLKLNGEDKKRYVFVKQNFMCESRSEETAEGRRFFVRYDNGLHVFLLKQFPNVVVELSGAEMLGHKSRSGINLGKITGKVVKSSVHVRNRTVADRKKMHIAGGIIECPHQPPHGHDIETGECAEKDYRFDSVERGDIIIFRDGEDRDTTRVDNLGRDTADKV